MRAVLLSVIGIVAAGSSYAEGFHGNVNAIDVAGLHAPAIVLRDHDGVPHIYAFDEHDALFMQGYLQAQDRLFQIDVLRRTASGTLAELVGQSALPSDVELRTIGLRRAAERSLAAYSAAARDGLQAYADGVNAWVQRNALPAEYALLELTRFDPWTALDSALIGKALAFQLSFDLDIDATLQYLEYQKKLIALNPQLGSQLADALFFLDVFRSAPFDPAASVPDANGPAPRPTRHGKAQSKGVWMSPAAAECLKQYRERIEQVPFMRRTLSRAERQIGSNEWAVAGRFTRNGRPLVANDPHLSLDLPPNFYDLQITTVKDRLDAIGSSVAGTPWIVLGQNRYVTWGETTTGFDVTDTYLEQVVPDPSSPSGLSTLYQGQPEPVIPIRIAFNVNLRDGGTPDTIVQVPAGGGIPPLVLIVPRRNNGPIVQLDQATGAAISVQYAGFGGTRELETFRLLNRARNLADFKAALQFFDVGSQNFIYGDIRGNIGYFTSGEVPLREDLQGGGINGAPPWFIRNGQGGNEWIRKENPGPSDGTSYEYLPFSELPQVVNPPSGFVVNANNDPAGVTLDNNPVNQLRPGGSGIYFLGYAFDFGTRAGRITQALRQKLERGRVDHEDMADLQADVTLLDASVLAPFIVRAFANARSAQAPPELKALANDPRVAEAVGRLAEWNYTAPSGVETGYDAADEDGYLLPPRHREVQASIAATIYSVWRGQAIANGVDRTLQGLGVPTPGSSEAMKALRHLIERDGIGLSTIDFFGWVPLGDPAQRRDFVLLKSLSDALDLLAGPAFAPAFAGSTAQGDYRWGRLHRITFDGILGGPFNIPGATPGFPPSFDDLPGLAVDGGFGVVDASSHSARSANAGAFTFGSGPNRRYVGSPHLWPGSIEARSILPGGNSGVLGNEFYANLLGRWLTNDTYPFRQQIDEVARALDSHQVYRPARAP
jgi:penicillin amidase